jgi:hypothetical protein
MRLPQPSAAFRIAACATGVLCLGEPGAAGASASLEAGPAVPAASARIDLAVKVPRVIRIRLLDHPATIAVSAEDVARGYVTVTGPRIDILVNDRLGYEVRAELFGTAFTAVRIAGLPAEVSATREASPARMPPMVGRARPEPYRVTYELELAKDAAPGSHPWPLALTLAGT